MAKALKKTVGKVVADSTYFHCDALDHVAVDVAELARLAQDVASHAAAMANVFKVDAKHRCVSLLNYPDFFVEPFPALSESWRVYLDDARVSYRTYQESTNPPILHRKELLLPPRHPRLAEFEQLTQQAEQLGLFEETCTIGFRRNWEERIRTIGYQLEGHAFQPIGNAVYHVRPDIEDVTSNHIERHRTALSRQGLSAPMQTLARNGLISEALSYFDYGCGRGDDLQALQANGLKASGWDPFFVPDAERAPADIVNLGFVINVIEDLDERITALQQAFDLAQQLLVVSVMLYTNATPVGKPYRDGYLTQRNTFQKYFSQNELKEFIETVLETEAIPVAPGIMYVFADKQAEQRFLLGRQRNHHTLRLLGYRRERQAQVRPPRPSKVEQLLATHGRLNDAIWQECLEFGRLPEKEESPHALEAVAAFGSWNKALRFVLDTHDNSELETAVSSRRDDLLVYLALQQFARRKPYRQLDESLQRDIRSFFGDYQKANAAAAALLYQIATPAEVEAACHSAAQKGLGYYQPGESLQLHVALVEQLPALLRVYIGCAVMLYGDLEGVDLVKIHTQSSKVTLLNYDQFADAPLPRLQERIKITLKTQSIDFFMYGGDYPPTLLYFKSRYINEEYPHYAEQQEFDEALQQLNLFDPHGYGLAEVDFWETLRLARKEVRGFALSRAAYIPNIDDPCGRYFTYRDLIECGETWEQLRVNNFPKESETYNAFYDLCVNVLDPVSDYFGKVILTFGFCSKGLARHIRQRICPPKDQHAGYELKKDGVAICKRGGAAVDFFLADEDMEEVVMWIDNNLTYDKIYFYGNFRPLHVSFRLHMNGRQIFSVQDMRPPRHFKIGKAYE